MDPTPQVTNPEDENVVLDVTEEDWQSPSEEPAAEEVEQEDASWTPDHWDGRIESIPDDTVRTTVERINKHMVRGVNQKFRELAELRKQYESKLESLNQPPPAKEDGPPEVDLSDPDSFRRTLSQRDQWLLKKAEENALGKVTPQLSEQQKQLVAYQQQQRLAKITSDPEFTEDVERRMVDLMSASEWWAQAASSDEGLEALFKTAKADVATSISARESAKRKASAASRTAPRSSGKGVTKDASPSDKYAGSFKEIGMQVLRETGLDPHAPGAWD